MVPTTSPTRYQIAAIHADGRTLVLGYTGRKSRYGVEAMIAGNLDQIRAFTALPSNTPFKYLTKPAGGYVAGDWFIGFTGKTERDVKNAPARKVA